MLIAFCLLGWSGHKSFFVMLLQYTHLFLGVVLFVRVWKNFLQRPIELGHCGLDALPFVLSVEFLVESDHEDCLLDHL